MIKGHVADCTKDPDCPECPDHGKARVTPWYSGRSGLSVLHVCHELGCAWSSPQVSHKTVTELWQLYADRAIARMDDEGRGST